MKLRFYAVTGNLVPDPRQRFRAQGEPAMFVGRYWDQEAHEQVTSKEPTVFDPSDIDNDRWAATLRSVKRGELWCANKETAEFCQVPFVELEYDDKQHVWSPKAPKSGGKS